MTLNPNSSPRDTSPDPSKLIGFEEAHVTGVNSHKEGDDVGHMVEVEGDFFEESIPAEVVTPQVGDVTIPEEGDRVLVGYRRNGRPVVLGSRYAESDTIPDFEPGERRIGHPASDSYIRLKADGTVRIEGDGGGVTLLKPDGQAIVADDSGYGMELQNNGEIHLYGKVKQHTSSTLDP